MTENSPAGPADDTAPDPTDYVEGHGRARLTDAGDDVAGHARLRLTDDGDDDVEGHAIRVSG